MLQSIDLLFDIVFNPLVENGQFNEEYFESEKGNLKQKIEAKKTINQHMPIQDV